MMSNKETEILDEKPIDFIRAKIKEDIANNKNEGRVHTRFPPEPNGYLHIGHSKSINLNFSLAKEFGGKCNLRFDDTNPSKEEVEYVDSIKRDIKWLGFDWADREYYASDYFDEIFEYAVILIKKGKAYVDSSSMEEIKTSRGMPTSPGVESPFRNRSVQENLDLFERMKNGEFKDGEHVLRAKIDMSSPNMNMRDPVLYRIKNESHHRTGDKWCIYPMYDMAHGQSDSIERITHSICTLEFENHRPLYDWLIKEIEIFPPQQIEFARLNISYTMMSKRKLLLLVQEGIVDGWDDPRMPTLSGMRRAGYTPEAINSFAEGVGVAKRNALVDVAKLEHSLRDHLNKITDRRMAVLNPLKVTITNYPGDQTEELEAINNPEDETAGIRKLPFCSELFIDRDDFMEDPPKKYFRLSPGNEVRLKYAYFIKCEEVLKNDSGEVIELKCTYDPETKSGTGTSTRKVKSTIHWVSARHAFDAEVRLYDRLFSVEDPASTKDGKDFRDVLNPNSLEILSACKLEPSLQEAKSEDKFQFERLGYFCVDSKYSSQGKPVFNRTVTLRDTWARINKK